jgi:hypothetical protein
MARFSLGRRIPALVAVLAAAVATLALSAGTASALAPPLVCSGGDIASGAYTSIRVTGACAIPDGANVTVNGNVTLDPGSDLNQMTVSTLRVMGNISVGQGAILSIGCTVIGMDCAADSLDRVNGNITAVNPTTMHIDGVVINGNFSSTGGGGPYDTYAFKDNSVKGNVTITGWNGGGWIGIIRNVVGGNVTYSNNTALDYGGDPNDANEVIHNTVGGNLACSGNSPVAQFGDGVPPLPDPYRWNVVRGRATGECADLVQH